MCDLNQWGLIKPFAEVTGCGEKICVRAASTIRKTA